MKTERFVISLLLTLLILLPLAVHAEAGRPLYAAMDENGKWGYIDAQGQWAIDPQFDEADDFRGDYAAAYVYPEDANEEDREYRNALGGIIDVTGAWVLEPQYDILSVSDSGNYAGGRDGGYFHVSVWSNSNKLCGWFNAPNGYFSGLLYEWVYIDWGESEACTGPALRATLPGGAWAYVDRYTGEYLIPPQEEVSPYGIYSEGFFPVEPYALLSGDGELIPVPEGYAFASWGSDQVMCGLIPVKEEATGLVAYMNTAGEIAIAPQFQGAWGFQREGVACVQFPEGDYGHIDTTGQVLYRGAAYGYEFSQGLAAVADESQEDTLIVLRESGEEAFRVTLEGLTAIRFWDDNGVGVYEVIKPTEHYMEDWDWSYSTLYACGLLSDQGEILTEPIFYLTEEDGWEDPLFAEGLAAMCNLEPLRMGYVDEAGQWVIPPQYEAAGDFRNGLARVWQDGEALFIDREGNVLFSFTRR